MLKVEITKAGTIVIRLPKSALKFATKHHPALERFDEKSGDFLYPKFPDINAFAKEVLHALRDEEEDGTTVVHEMLDKAIVNAIEAGAEGILMPGDDGYSKKRSRASSSAKGPT